MRSHWCVQTLGCLTTTPTLPQTSILRSKAKPSSSSTATRCIRPSSFSLSQDAQLGHAIETVSHRPGSLCCLSHGQAVAIGCVVSARVSVALGCCEESVIQRTIDLCEKFQLPTQVPPDQCVESAATSGYQRLVRRSIDAVMKALRKTKVYSAEGCQFALLERIGRLFNVDAQYHLPVSDDVIREATVATMSPPGTVIQGVGSSGFLRRKKGSKADTVQSTADKKQPGAGWTIEVGHALHAC